MKKVVLLNGSPRANGCTATALQEMVKVFEEEGIEAEILQIGSRNIRGCMACGYCHKNGKCVIDDYVNEIAPKIVEADGIVIGSPGLLRFPERNDDLLSGQAFLQQRRQVQEYCRKDARRRIGRQLPQGWQYSEFRCIE